MLNIVTGGDTTTTPTTFDDFESKTTLLADGSPITITIETYKAIISSELNPLEVESKWTSILALLETVDGQIASYLTDPTYITKYAQTVGRCFVSISYFYLAGEVKASEDSRTRYEEDMKWLQQQRNLIDGLNADGSKNTVFNGEVDSVDMYLIEGAYHNVYRRY